MKLSRFIALSVLAAMLATLAPQAPVSADGAASTRNIILLGTAATLVILNHNKKVHQRYAEDAATQAALASQRDDARAAYVSEKKAYDSEAALVTDLNKEVAYQHQVIEQQRRQIAAFQPSGGGGVRPASDFVAQTTLVKPTAMGGSQQVAVTSYGWGSI